MQDLRTFCFRCEASDNWFVQGFSWSFAGIGRCGIDFLPLWRSQDRNRWFDRYLNSSSSDPRASAWAEYRFGETHLSQDFAQTSGGFSWCPRFARCEHWCVGSAKTLLYDEQGIDTATISDFACGLIYRLCFRAFQRYQRWREKTYHWFFEIVYIFSYSHLVVFHLRFSIWGFSCPKISALWFSHLFSCIQNVILYIFSMNQRFFPVIKLLIVFFALSLAVFLAFGDRGNDTAPDQKIVFVVDSNKTMNTQDVLTGAKHISRFQAAKLLIQKTILSEPQYAYGLIIFNAGADYLIPPTSDTWTFLLYLSGMTTNLLPDWHKDFVQLSWFFHDDGATSYLIISDFDTVQQSSVRLPKWTTLLGLWSLAGDKVRHSNGIVYYDNGKSVFSARNDQLAKSLGVSYTSASDITYISLPKLLFHGFNLPLSQRIFLYGLLGVLVVLAVLL